MSDQIIIYGLIDPRTDEYFYIGKTIHINKRLKEHIKDKKEINPYKYYVIQKILRSGLKPYIKPIFVFKNYIDKTLRDEGSYNNWWEHVEIFYINYYKNTLNQPLTNIAKGGDASDIEFLYKPISQFDFNGNFINSYISISDAVRKTKLDLGTLSKCCNKKEKSAGGYQWCFVGDEGLIKKYNINEHNERQMKPVSQYTLDNVFIKRYNSIKGAGKETGVNKDAIKQNLKGKSNSAGGYKWKLQ